MEYDLKSSQRTVHREVKVSGCDDSFMEFYDISHESIISSSATGLDLNYDKVQPTEIAHFVKEPDMMTVKQWAGPSHPGCTLITLMISLSPALSRGGDGSSGPFSTHLVLGLWWTL